MTTTMNSNQIYTLQELRFFLDWCVQATECHIYPYGYDDKDTSEDPIACLHGVDETINWIYENPAYCKWGEMIGYMVVYFNDAGSCGGVIF